MLRGDVCALEVLSGRSLVDGLAATTAVMDNNGAGVKKGYDEDENDVADDVSWGGCEAEASEPKNRGGLVKMKDSYSN